jgi:hypothetical protein
MTAGNKAADIKAVTSRKKHSNMRHKNVYRNICLDANTAAAAMNVWLNTARKNLTKDYCVSNKKSSQSIDELRQWHEKHFHLSVFIGCVFIFCSKWAFNIHHSQCVSHTHSMHCSTLRILRYFINVMLFRRFLLLRIKSVSSINLMNRNFFSRFFLFAKYLSASFSNSILLFSLFKM